MTYRNILVHLDYFGPAQPRMSLAMDLATRFKSGLIGFAAHQIPTAIMSEAAGLIIQAEHTEIEKRLEALRTEFMTSVPAELQLDWRSVVDSPARALAKAARAADLIVTGTATGVVNGDATIDLGGLVIAAGRPVLLTGDSDRLYADNVVIAWKDTKESRRAVRDAMPFLTAAKQVTTITIDDSDSPDAEASVEDVSRYLVRHGVRSRTQLTDPAGQRVADRLVALAKELGADLIVSGAYGHGRLREWAFRRDQSAAMPAHFSKQTDV
jgi:nucleotide-binding universal stress UspA family protein